MTPYPHEIFFTEFMGALVVILSVGVVFTSVYVGIFRHRSTETHEAPTSLLSQRPPEPTKSRKGSSMTDKLGQKIVNYLIEVSVSEDKNLIEDRIKKILAECEKLSQQPLPKENKEIISTVAIWAKQFNIERHLRDMKMLKFSTQIVYDKAHNDFKLMIAGK
ncbi:hypothetical protein [Thermospira aquatica]|uniref:Uncharacterized protein n=1 Tax=Thermospira aquatica TaxID=2828656 RepID=A0AAX3BFD9_9SPIR|nr:hypothetical protein [Thermospira aquatica]URA10818.1 hypothetical protein KDW03_03160 [Thermospira aquatica]